MSQGRKKERKRNIWCAQRTPNNNPLEVDVVGHQAIAVEGR